MILKRILISFATIFNVFVFIGTIVFTILTFTNLSNWALMILWYFTLPINIIIVVFGLIGIIKLVKKQDLNIRKQKLLKFLPIISIVYTVCIFLIIMILLFA